MLPPDLLAAICSGATIVTPNNRLARRIVELHDDARRRAGATAWPAVSAMPWNAWLSSLWLDLAAADPGTPPPRVLSVAQVGHLWRRTVAAEPASLIDADGVADLAAAAWALVHAWGTGGASWRAWEGGDDDPAVFARWAQSHARALMRTSAIDTAQLPDALAERVAFVPQWRAMEVRLAGFIEMAPQQQRLVAALEAAGARISRCGTVRETPGALACASGAMPRDELARALTWARERALADPDATIGIVVDDLAARRDEIVALADAILCPALQAPGHESAPRPYNLSLGVAVGDAPIVAVALDLIGIGHAAMPVGRVAALLRSPYLPGDVAGGLRRASLESQWLHAGRREVAFTDAVQSLQPVDRALADRWHAARIAKRLPAQASPREWTSAWRAWLDAAGWPGGRALSSAEWQAREAFDALLAQFAGFGAIESSIDAGDAVAALRALASSTVFQPEASPAPVQIMGRLEAAGLPLDALWVTGLSAEAWPPAPRPNPLLPLAWQRDRGVPHTSAAGELDFAKALMEQFAAGAPEVVFSYPRSDHQHALVASSLLPEVPAMPADRHVPHDAARAQFAARPARESIADDRAPALPAGTRVRGGARAIENQSDCPFRAFALHRLGAEPWPEPLAGLSAMERGNLVHEALAAFWRDGGGHADLIAQDAPALDARIDAAADAALATIPSWRWRALPPPVPARERAHVAELVRAWVIGFDRDRLPFAAPAVEVTLPMSMGGLAFEFRADRIDTLDAGGIAIIDYKTGSVAKPPAWFDVRPQAPQLGLYALARLAQDATQPVRAVAFAQLKRGEMDVQGIAADPDAWPLLKQPAEIRRANLADWPAVEAFWKASLDGLAEEIAAGHAPVAPRDRRKTCRHCGLQALCRIGAAVQDDDAEDDDE